MYIGIAITLRDSTANIHVEAWESEVGGGMERGRSGAREGESNGGRKGAREGGSEEGRKGEGAVGKDVNRRMREGR